MKKLTAPPDPRLHDPAHNKALALRRGDRLTLAGTDYTISAISRLHNWMTHGVLTLTVHKPHGATLYTVEARPDGSYSNPVKLY